MNTYAHIQDGTVTELVRPFITETNILTPDATGALEVTVPAGEQVPLERLYSPEFCAACQLVTEGLQVAVGDSFVDGEFGPPLAQPAFTAAQILQLRDGFLAQAALRIAPLDDAVDLGVETPEDVDALTAWKQYRVALNRIEQQSGFPTAVEWPKAPE